jgi:hypothetical protein
MSPSEREKACIDVMLATLDCAVDWRADPAASEIKLTLVFGLAVHLCAEHGIAEPLAVEFLRTRYAEYRELFPSGVAEA